MQNYLILKSVKTNSLIHKVNCCLLIIKLLNNEWEEMKMSMISARGEI